MGKNDSHNRIDEAIHQRTRLAIMATLAGVTSLDFTFLKTELDLSDGNLCTHLASLQRAGYVKLVKGFRGRIPRTTVAMTSKGRKAMTNYVNPLQSILDKAK